MRWTGLPRRSATVSYTQLDGDKRQALGRSLSFKVRNAGDRTPTARRFELKAGGLVGLIAPAIAVDYDLSLIHI